MAPGKIAAHQRDKIRLFQICINARHNIFAKSAAVAGNRTCHAEPRITVYIAGAEETLRELIGRIIIFSQ